MPKKKKITKKIKRPLIKLLCSECKQEFRSTRKNPTNTPDRLELIKFCSHCRKRTKHKETK